MSLLSLILYLIVVGLVVYLLDMLPIDARIKRVIQAVVIVVVVIWLLQALGLLINLDALRIGR